MRTNSNDSDGVEADALRRLICGQSELSLTASIASHKHDFSHHSSPALRSRRLPLAQLFTSSSYRCCRGLLATVDTTSPDAWDRRPSIPPGMCGSSAPCAHPTAEELPSLLRPSRRPLSLISESFRAVLTTRAAIGGHSRTRRDMPPSVVGMSLNEVGAWQNTG
jgi:hypothetical protein